MRRRARLKGTLVCAASPKAGLRVQGAVQQLVLELVLGLELGLELGLVWAPALGWVPQSA